MKPSGYSLLETKPGVEKVLVGAVVVTEMGAKSVFTLPKLAPAFTPKYQPVQL
jgi:hypothetical protein